MLICAFGSLLATPNLFTKQDLVHFPSWMPKDKLNLGLDLRGGSHLLLEVDLKSIFRERMSNLVQSIRTELRKDRIGYSRIGVSGDAASVTIRKPDEKSKNGRDGETNLDRARKIIRRIEQGTTVDSESSGKLTIRYTVEALRERRNQALNQSIEIVRRRVDEYGTSEPTIQRQGLDRILVQLPGVD
ncbi:MAG: protein translocase subunit SecD, partial [Rhodospirillales bacterium]|nr:protein translocase subunit SecD [Rhodospirillales bacterium]